MLTVVPSVDMVLQQHWQRHRGLNLRPHCAVSVKDSVMNPGKTILAVAYHNFMLYHFSRRVLCIFFQIDSNEKAFPSTVKARMPLLVLLQTLAVNLAPYTQADIFLWDRRFSNIIFPV